jgi:hypothetical protein
MFINGGGVSAGKSAISGVPGTCVFPGGVIDFYLLMAGFNGTRAMQFIVGEVWVRQPACYEQAKGGGIRAVQMFALWGAGCLALGLNVQTMSAFWVKPE